MDIFTELEKLRMNHYDDELWENSKSCKRIVDRYAKCDCGADKHNETLDGIISFLKKEKADNSYSNPEDRMTSKLKKIISEYQKSTGYAIIEMNLSDLKCEIVTRRMNYY